MKQDPYNHKERYLNWRKNAEEKGVSDITKENSEIILQYLDDMENGINVAQGSIKGGRSYIRLNSLREKTRFFARKFKELYNLDKMTDVSEEQLCIFCSGLRKGTIRRRDGTQYQAPEYFAITFKAFWHWWTRHNKKKGIEIQDITLDLDTKGEKPRWVYLTEEQIKLLCNQAKYEYKVLIMFLFDTGIRSPTELINVKVSDLYNGCKELNIRDEISKTFGRRIKLMLCSDLLKEYIKLHNLSKEDYLFSIKPPNTNRYLRRLGKRVLGDKQSPAGQKYSELTMYDFRHCSCCYWLPRYKSELALKFRFGWKKSDKIHYYSEMLGMKDTISEEDMLVDVTKTELELQLQKTNNEKEILQERVTSMEAQMQQVMDLVKSLKNGILATN